jgi:hypothetical protein
MLRGSAGQRSLAFACPSPLESLDRRHEENTFHTHRYSGLAICRNAPNASAIASHCNVTGLRCAAMLPMLLYYEPLECFRPAICGSAPALQQSCGPSAEICTFLRRSPAGGRTEHMLFRLNEYIFHFDGFRWEKECIISNKVPSIYSGKPLRQKGTRCRRGRLRVHSDPSL